MFDPDKCLDDASSKMCKTTPLCSESEPREQGSMNIIQHCSDSNSEVNNQLLQPESSMASELNSYKLNLLLNEMLDNDETFDEVTANNRTDNYSKEELESMVHELFQAGDTTFSISVKFHLKTNTHMPSQDRYGAIRPNTNLVILASRL